jgi:hypothetical protein
VGQILELPDDLYDELRQIAEQRHLTVESLIVQWVKAMPRTPEEGGKWPDQEQLELTAATRALIEGEEPPVPVDWEELRRALQQSEPACPTIEEAMTALRSRPWSMDE